MGMAFVTRIQSAESSITHLSTGETLESHGKTMADILLSVETTDEWQEKSKD